MKFRKPILLLLFCAPLIASSYGGQPVQRDSWDVPECASVAEYRTHRDAYVKMPATGLFLFLIRAKDVRYKKVTDVDYELHIFSHGPREQASVMQGWFGPYASNRSVREKSIRKSASYTEGWAKLEDYRALDTYGQTTAAKHWRYLDLGSSALYYEDASKEGASVFDSMLKTMCYEMWKQ